MNRNTGPLAFASRNDLAAPPPPPSSRNAPVGERVELIAKLLGEAHAGLDRLEQQLAPVLVSAAPTCAGDKMQAGHPETARCPMVEDLDSIADAILSFVAREQGLIARLEL